MTANAMQGDRDCCMAAGMNDHVVKPIEPDDLWKALLKWIKPKYLQIPLGGVKPVANQDTGLLPFEIDGLDMVNGLHRVLGKKPFYISMLRKFVSGQKFVAVEILTALANNDRTTAERLAHTLKGTSGNIGATGLQQLAEKVETAIREKAPQNDLDGLLTTLKYLLSHLVEQLEQKLPKDPEKLTTIIDPEKFKLLCDRLEILLVDDDAEAADVLEDNADLFNSAFPIDYCKIDQSIRTFDFEAALSSLRLAVRTYI
jgi:HPt (histidine-containing phosphotransfer) domain-containing protein